MSPAVVDGSSGLTVAQYGAPVNWSGSISSVRPGGGGIRGLGSPESTPDVGTTRHRRSPSDSHALADPGAGHPAKGVRAHTHSNGRSRSSVPFLWCGMPRRHRDPAREALPGLVPDPRYRIRRYETCLDCGATVRLSPANPGAVGGGDARGPDWVAL